MKLYSYWRSSASYRVRIALAWKGLVFDYVPISLAGEQWSSAHRARSPMGKVPALELDDGRVVTESIAIIEYLEEMHPAPPLLPSDPYLRARARMLAELVNSGIQPLQNTVVQKHVKDVLHGDEKTWIAHWVGGGIAALEQAVAGLAGRFCIGDEPSIADLYLVPQLYFARRFAVDLSAAPTLVRIDAECQTLKAFAAAHPNVQPDAPPAT